MATVLRYMKSLIQEEGPLEDDIQLYDNMSHDGLAGRNLNSLEDIN